MNSLNKVIDIGNEFAKVTGADAVDELDQVRKEFLSIYYQPEKGVDLAGATEVIVDYINEKYWIYTVRDDDRNEMWIYQEGIYTPNGKTVIKEIVREVTLKRYKKSVSDVVISKVEADTGIDKHNFFKEEDLKYCCLKNGVFDLQLGKLLPFTPDLRFFNKINASHDINATCEGIIKFFKSVLSSDIDLALMQEVIGSCLYREYRWEKSFMFLGSGRNGKGKSIALIKNFLGADNVSSLSLSSIANGGTMVGDLFGKLANVAGDLSKTSLKETGLFKEVTGRDMITCDRKYKTPLHFVNYAKMVFCANELPYVYDNSLGFYDRWEIIDFKYTFVPESEYNEADDKKYLKIRDPNIIDAISTQEELDGLFLWAYEGLQRLMNNSSFSKCMSSDATKRQWMRNSSSFNGFIMDCTSIALDSWVSKEKLRQYYMMYCQLYKLDSANDTVIKKALELEGVGDSRKSGTWGWFGISLKKWEDIFKDNKELLIKASTIQSNLNKIGAITEPEILIVTEERIKV
jgi:putative DNA primase/helicase